MKRAEFIRLFAQYKAERMTAEGERPSVVAMTHQDSEKAAARLWKIHGAAFAGMTPAELRAAIFANVAKP